MVKTTLLTLLSCSIAVVCLASNDSPPVSPVKLIFIHHSTGGNWLADPNADGPYGGLGLALMNNNYVVSATNYGWGRESIGDRTDIPNWPEWFGGPDSSAILSDLYNETGQNIGDFGDWSRPATGVDGENTIVMFKSCFPNSDLFGNPTDPPGTTADDQYTVSNAKTVYNSILTYFETHQDKLFFVITAPPQLESDYSADYQSAAQRAANARALNDWLVNDWLDHYAHNNVAVFDYFNVLTAAGNHHRYSNGAVEHVTVNGNNFAVDTVDTWDSHPSTSAHQKATEEFVPLLNYFYNRWQDGGGTANPQWVDIGGTVSYNGAGLCTMILANGQYMFTCGAAFGSYAMQVPTDDRGNITLFSFCNGLAPFTQVLTPAQAASYDIRMSLAAMGSPSMNLTHAVAPATRPGWVTLSGTATYGGTPLNMMILANGQHMFTPPASGAYSLDVPLDAAGQVTLFGFCDGLLPFKQTISP